MAIRVHCPSCNEYLADMAEVCPNCDAALPPGVVMSLAAANGAPVTHTFVHHTASPQDELIPVSGIEVPPHLVAAPSTPPESSGLRPWLAAVLSLVCGLGQLYNGQVIKGVVLMVLGALALWMWPSLASKIAIPVLWGFAIIDAFRQARPRHH